MKLLTLCCFVLIVSVLNAQDIEVPPESEEIYREEYCSTSKYPKKDECSSFRCNKDNSKIIGVGCAEARCSGRTIGFKGDSSKPYPECCMIPVCEDSRE